MRKRSQRLWMIGAAAVLGLGAIALAVPALQTTMNFFYSPSEVIAKDVASTRKSVRVGGLVEVQSVKHDAGGQLLFTITDTKNTVAVVYDKLPPDLFEEGKGVVAEGRFDEQGRFIASRVLAKHDENYISPEAYKALREAGGEGATKEPVS
jgi:cytochrome c-type biogenesis protein CcmE